MDDLNDSTCSLNSILVVCHCSLRSILYPLTFQTECQFAANALTVLGGCDAAASSIRIKAIAIRCFKPTVNGLQMRSVIDLISLLSIYTTYFLIAANTNAINALLETLSEWLLLTEEPHDVEEAPYTRPWIHECTCCHSS